MPSGIKLFFVPFPGATSRALSNGANHVCLRLIVAGILTILWGIPSVKIGSATSRPILTKLVFFERSLHFLGRLFLFNRNRSPWWRYSFQKRVKIQSNPTNRDPECNIYARERIFSEIYVNILRYISTQKPDFEEIKKAVLETFMLYRINSFWSTSAHALLNEFVQTVSRQNLGLTQYLCNYGAQKKRVTSIERAREVTLGMA